MRTTITIDDELYRKALEVADPGTDKADLVREAMRVFVRVQSGNMKDIPRRRPVTQARK
jgi:Arc/MetJ family transcription regulator